MVTGVGHGYNAQVAPNVLFFVDDLGYMDVGANHPGTFYETPHIDRLAAKACASPIRSAAQRVIVSCRKISHSCRCHSVFLW